MTYTVIGGMGDGGRRRREVSSKHHSVAIGYQEGYNPHNQHTYKYLTNQPSTTPPHHLPPRYSLSVVVEVPYVSPCS